MADYMNSSLRESLIGTWSAYAYGGYGTMEDELITFRPDGTGWYAFDRGFLCERETFEWAVINENMVQVQGITYAVIQEDEPGYKERPSRMPVRIAQAIVETGVVEWPQASKALILTLDRRLFAGATKFALLTSNLNKLALPEFEMRQRH
jgi:hypothetical protein